MSGVIKSKYQTSKNISLTNEKTNYDINKINAIAIYTQNKDNYDKIDVIPNTGYVFDNEKSYCTINGKEAQNITINYDNN